MIKILTYNIHKGFDRYNRDFVLHRIKDHLQSAEVDGVLLQEIQGLHLQHQTSLAAWPDVSQFEFLADSIWPHYAYGKNAIYRKGHHGNAILSKFNIIEWNNLNLSRFQRASRSMLHGRVELPDSKTHLHLLCVHLDLLGFERKRQLRELKSYIDSSIDASEGDSGINRWPPVFVRFTPRPRAFIVIRISTRLRAKSTCSQRSASISPRRVPVPNMN